MSDTTLRLRFVACDQCGALVAVFADDSPVIDNADAHREWHSSVIGDGGE